MYVTDLKPLFPNRCTKREVKPLHEQPSTIVYSELPHSCYPYRPVCADWRWCFSMHRAVLTGQGCASAAQCADPLPLSVQGQGCFYACAVCIQACFCLQHVGSLMAWATAWIFENCNQNACKPAATCSAVASRGTFMSQTRRRIEENGFHSHALNKILLIFLMMLAFISSVDYKRILVKTWISNKIN